MQCGDDFFVFVGKQQIAVLAHDLDDQIARDRKAHLVAAGELQLADAIKADLPRLHQFAAAELFAQQHAQHRRRRRVFLDYGGKAELRVVCPCIDRQAQIAALCCRMQRDDDLILLRLLYFFHTRVLRRPVDLPDDSAASKAMVHLFFLYTK